MGACEVVLLDTKKKRKWIRHWYNDTVDAMFGDFDGGLYATKGEDIWEVHEYQGPRNLFGNDILPKPKIGDTRYPTMHKVVLERDDDRLVTRTGERLRVYALAYAPLGETEKGVWEKQLPKPSRGQ